MSPVLEEPTGKMQHGHLGSPLKGVAESVDEGVQYERSELFTACGKA